MKWSDLSGTAIVTDLQTADMLMLLRTSDGADGSKVIDIDDLIAALDDREGKHIYAIHGQMLEVQAGSAIILGVMPLVDIVIPAETLTCGIAKVAATALTVFTVKKNGGTVGSITVNAGTTTPVSDFASPVTLLGRTDYLEVFNPASPDATLNGMYFGFRGLR
jgi:hypothetical protein